MLTSKQRAILRKEAQALPVVFQVGKGEIDQALVKSTAECLAARELIKMKVLETSMYTPREAADALAEQTGADCVQVIGSKFVLYLQKKKEDVYKRQISPRPRKIFSPWAPTWAFCPRWRRACATSASAICLWPSARCRPCTPRWRMCNTNPSAAAKRAAPSRPRSGPSQQGGTLP